MLISLFLVLRAFQFNTLIETRLLQTIRVYAQQQTVFYNFQPLRSNKPQISLYMRHFQIQCTNNFFFLYSLNFVNAQSYQISIRQQSAFFVFWISVFVSSRLDVIETAMYTMLFQQGNTRLGVIIPLLKTWSTSFQIFSCLNGFETSQTGVKVVVGISSIEKARSSLVVGLQHNVLQAFNLKSVQMSYILVDPSKLYFLIEKSQVNFINSGVIESLVDTTLRIQSSVYMQSSNRNLIMGIQFYHTKCRLSFIATTESSSTIKAVFYARNYYQNCVTNFLTLLYTDCNNQFSYVTPLNQIGCIPSCPQNLFRFQPLKACLSCHYACLLCLDPTDCYSCRQGLLLQRNRRCVCPIGNFLRYDVGQFCQSCSFLCEECISPTLCVVCKPMKNLDLQDNLCRATCQQNCISCDSPANCLQCRDNFFLKEGTCYLKVQDLSLVQASRGFRLQSKHRSINQQISIRFQDCLVKSEVHGLDKAVQVQFKANKFFCRILLVLPAVLVPEQKLFLPNINQSFNVFTSSVGRNLRISCKQNLKILNCSFLFRLRILNLTIKDQNSKLSFVSQTTDQLTSAVQISIDKSEVIKLDFYIQSVEPIKYNHIKKEASVIFLTPLTQKMLEIFDQNFDKIGLSLTSFLIIGHLMGLNDVVQNVVSSLSANFIILQSQRYFFPPNYLHFLDKVQSINNLFSFPIPVGLFLQNDQNLEIVVLFLINNLIKATIHFFGKLAIFLVKRVCSGFKKIKERKVHRLFSLSLEFQVNLLISILKLNKYSHLLAQVFIIWQLISLRKVFLKNKHNVGKICFQLLKLLGTAAAAIINNFFFNFSLIILLRAIIIIRHTKSKPKPCRLQTYVLHALQILNTGSMCLLWVDNNRLKQGIGWVLFCISMLIVLIGLLITVKSVLKRTVSIIKAVKGKKLHPKLREVVKIR